MTRVLVGTRFEIDVLRFEGLLHTPKWDSLVPSYLSVVETDPHLTPIGSPVPLSGPTFPMEITEYPMSPNVSSPGPSTVPKSLSNRVPRNSPTWGPNGPTRVSTGVRPNLLSPPTDVTGGLG